MSLTELYVSSYSNAAVVTAGQTESRAEPKVSELSKTKSFKTAFNDAGDIKANSETEPPKHAKTKPQTDKADVKTPDKPAKKVDEAKPRQDEAKKTGEDAKAEELSEAVKTDKSAKTESAEAKPAPKDAKNAEGDLTAEQEQLVAAIAASLNISVEKAAEILADMGANPEELSDPVKLTEFIQRVVGAQTPAELLTVPNVKQMFTAVKETIENFVPETTEEQTAQTVEFTKEVSAQAAAQSAFNERQAVNGRRGDNRQAAETNENGGESVVIKGNVKVEKTTAEAFSEELIPEEELIPQEAEQIQTAAATAANVTVRPQVASVSEAAGTDTGAANNVSQVNSAVTAPTEQREAAVTQVRTEAARNVNTQDVINQIVEKMKVEVKSDVSTEIKVTLRPEHLGDVTMKIVTQNGIVTAMFVAQSQRVKEIIEAGFTDLRDTLAQQGVNISELSVSVGQDSQTNERETGGSGYSSGGGIVFEEDSAETAPVTRQDGDLSVDYRI